MTAASSFSINPHPLTKPTPKKAGTSGWSTVKKQKK